MAVPFVVNEIIVSPGPRHAEAVQLLRLVAEQEGVDINETKHSRDLARVLHDTRYARTPRSFVLTDRPGDYRVGGPWDAPTIVDKCSRHDPELGIMIQLNHVYSAHAALGATPITIGHGTGGFSPISIGHSTGGFSPISIGHSTGGFSPISIGHGTYLPFDQGEDDQELTPSGALDDYGIVGSGGRQPVEWVGEAPTRRPDSSFTGPDRRPVVVTLDTGIGVNEWWYGTDPQTKERTWKNGVTRGLSLDGVKVGYSDRATDPELKGIKWGELTGVLDTHSGHGTFIAGLIRQVCPDADIRAVRIMGSNGIANEYELLRCLLVLAELVTRHRKGRPGGMAVDVIVMSLGYQHESLADVKYDGFMLPVLRELGKCGVSVVAAAGNSASTQPVYPAAFTPYKGGVVPAPEVDCVPVTSVGSLNPNSTVALYSNSGPWVNAWEKSAAVVSTMPTTLDGGAQPTISFIDSQGHTRETVDLDDFSSGFGVWSGTSFAAPVFAGKVAAALLATGRLAQGLPAAEVSAIVTELASRTRPHRTARAAK